MGRGLAQAIMQRTPTPVQGDVPKSLAEQPHDDRCAVVADCGRDAEFYESADQDGDYEPVEGVAERPGNNIYT